MRCGQNAPIIWVYAAIIDLQGQSFVLTNLRHPFEVRFWIETICGLAVSANEYRTVDIHYDLLTRVFITCLSQRNPSQGPDVYALEPGR